MITVSSTPRLYQNAPQIIISGLWLNDCGFKNSELVMSEYHQNKIIFKLVKKEQSQYIDAVKEILQTKSNNLFLVMPKPKSIGIVPHFKIVGETLRESGFEIGTKCALHWEYGIISIYKI
jgi:hypothetical protein